MILQMTFIKLQTAPFYIMTVMSMIPLTRVDKGLPFCDASDDTISKLATSGKKILQIVSPIL